MKVKLTLLYISALALGAFFGQFTSSLVGVLPEAVSESSGLLYFDDTLISHNDSGNAPILYQLNKKTFKVEKEIEVVNAKNIDWEDLAQDQNYIYVGDFGNYWGDREDLVVYKLSKKDIRTLSKVTAEKIYFNYPDKKNNTRKSSSNFDAEAMFCKNNELYILTKQWREKKTSAYKIPVKPGKCVATKVGEYNTKGLVTGATYNKQDNSVLLVGYNMFMMPFVVEIENSSANNLFTGTVKKTQLDLGFVQMEGVTTYTDGTYYLSSESFTKLGASASIYKLNAN
ncbi:hypothetical protein KLA_09774 [Cellulophaga geojensis KL-A]|uniref:Uncharacterized protein n=1 Tax=Cellulophaga geojensis KL-A TaxID=1328323 RepID=A0ABN0RNB4_9FLAO|nr:hypothetical protein [Cellulophaga geojensis]EWH13409.1 hypothetical protein KLA_09774 [Cellulophaga geojensis KL-A]